jgi:CheY-like chemotaxis protein
VSGEDALSKLQAARWMFDVVFVDENLSTEDGLFGHELVALMRRQSQMSTSVIIACTSNPAKVSDKLLAAGVDHVWPKPPPLPSVIKPKIDQLLEQRIKAYSDKNSSTNHMTTPGNGSDTPDHNGNINI